MENEQITTNMRDWSKSKYVRPVRLTQESHTWLKEKKGKKCMAGFLEDILSKHIRKQAKNESVSGSVYGHITENSSIVK